MWNEFKKFALEGNVMDLAIAVVIGAAFGKIISSLVDDIITPLIGILMGGIDFTRIIWHVEDANVFVGNFIQSVVDFTIVTFSVYMVIRLMMKLQSKKEKPMEKEHPIDTKETLLMEIRDLLKDKKTK